MKTPVCHCCNQSLKGAKMSKREAIEAISYNNVGFLIGNGFCVVTDPAGDDPKVFQSAFRMRQYCNGWLRDANKEVILADREDNWWDAKSRQRAVTRLGKIEARLKKARTMKAMAEWLDEDARWIYSEFFYTSSC